MNYIFNCVFPEITAANLLSGMTNKQIYICFKKRYNGVGESVYAARYIKYRGFRK